MTKQVNQTWVLLLRVPGCIEEDDQLRMYGSSVTLCRQSIFPDLSPLFYDRLLEQVLKDHWDHHQPFQAVMIDTFHSLEESEVKRVTWILRPLPRGIPVILVLRKKEAEITVYRSIKLFAYDWNNHSFPDPGQAIPDSSLPYFLIRQLAG